MKAMILAAGRGERMRPLTDTTPKPLLKVAGKPIIHHTIEKLSKAGFRDIVINVAHLGDKIIHNLNDGKELGVHIQYSIEKEGLETAGGIINALPLLGQEPFLVVNGDISCDFPLETLKKHPKKLAHLVLVENPSHHAEGDFAISNTGDLNAYAVNRYTYSGIGVYHPKLFDNITQGKRRLAPVLRQAMRQQSITGEKYEGFWLDIGTPDRLLELETYICQKNKV